MDELLHHCIRELGFEGNLGCDVNRLQDFIRDFHAHSQPPQNVDAAYCAFVWSIIVPQPEVRVGLAPEGEPEVFVAPQSSKGTKQKKKKAEEEDDDDDDVAAAGALAVVDDAAVRSLEDLKAQYGDHLRIAVDPQTSFVAITGSHIRPSKLTPMVYTVLQFISRAREKGISTVDISSKTGYDAKTCHYLVDKLLELNLIEKRKKSGVGTNICIHKYFFERSEIWKEIVAEEGKLHEPAPLKQEEENDSVTDDDESASAPALGQIQYEPIGTNHISSLRIVRNRLQTLLRNSPHHTHSAQNLLVTIGFPNPSKTDRRFFNRQLRALIAMGIIERIQVPRGKEEKGKERFVSCIRLVDIERQEQPSTSAAAEAEDESELPTLKANISFHRQMLDLVSQSGSEGVTLNQLSQALCTFDKRTVDHQLNRLKEAPAPPHLRDLGLAQVSETSGRERRYKYFTAQNYQEIVEREKLPAQYAPDYFAHVGGFMPLDEERFYANDRELNKFVDSYQVGDQEKRPVGRPKGTKNKAGAAQKTARAGQKRKRGDEDDGGAYPPEAAQDEDVPPVKRKRGRPPKPRAPQPTAPALAPSTSGPVDTDAVGEPSPVPKKRGRPPKAKPEGTPASPKKRGRPPKIRAVEVAPEMPTANSEVAGEPAPSAGEIPHPSLPLPDAPPSTSQAKRPRRPSQPRAAPGQLIAPRDVQHAAPEPQESAMDVDQTGARDDAACGPSESTSADAEVIHGDGSTSARVVERQEGVSMPQAQPEVPLPSAVATSASGQPVAAPAAQNKRPAPGTPLRQTPSKRTKAATPQTEQRAMTNLTQSRRDKEILRVITEKGGIINVSSKDLNDAHAALMKTLSEAGEAVSTAPGSNIDRRTVDKTLSSLENQGKLKTISTIMGANRLVRIAYLSDTPQETLNAYLAALGRAQLPISVPPPVKTLEEPIAYGGAKLTKVVKPPPSVVFLIRSTDGELERGKVADLLKLDDESIKESLLTESNTIKQLYCFIVRKVARARALHMHATSVFEKGINPQIVSADERIMHVSYFFQDIPIAEYCKLVSSPDRCDELMALLSTPEGRATPVSQAPPAIAKLLELTKTRSRTLMLKVLLVLQHLQLITPLQPSKSDNPWLRCAPNGEHPTAFDATSYDGTAPLQAPQYWRFNPNAPIYFWILDEVAPALWETAPVKTTAEAQEFWGKLQKASLDEVHARQVTTERETGGLPAPIPPARVPGGIAKLLRRSSEWKGSYHFSWFQERYLCRSDHLDPQTGATPLQDDDGGEARLAKIADVVCAPREDVEQFYVHERTRLLRDIDRARKRTESAGERSRRRAEEKISLAQKSAEAKALKERNWDEMLLRVHPEPLGGLAATRVSHVRTRFLQGTGTDQQKWEGEIATAIEDARIAAHTAPSRVPAANPAPRFAPAPPTVQSHEKNVEDLIAQQGPLLAKQEALGKKKKTKGKGKEKETEANGEEDKTGRRRHRFLWNKDFEELARDASAIIKARCREGKRLDWSALEQVFPAVPRNSVRQRIATLREQPGAEAYLKRLEDRWYDLWVKYRGTPELPDDDPTSLSNFDLAAHVTFLRRHVDKIALRVGFLERDEPTLAALPATVSALLHGWQVVEKPSSETTWDFLWHFASEEGREKQLIQQAFVLNGPCIPAARTCLPEPVYVGEGALKMMLGTSNDVYDADHASHVLASVGENEIKKAMQELIDQGVASKVTRDPKKSRPGRLLRISEPNHSALGGPIAAELIQDASALEEALSHQEDPLAWKEWPLLASDGDTAALIEMVSENKVDFKIDTSGPQAARVRVDWNSKKAADDDFEAAIQVRFATDAAGCAPSAVLQSAITPERAPQVEQDQISYAPVEGESGEARSETQGTADDTHAKTFDGKEACCSKALAAEAISSVNEVVDCEACIMSKIAEVDSPGESDRELSKRLWSALVEAGSDGLQKRRLLTFAESFDRPSLSRSLTRLIASGLTFWAGQTDIVLVSGRFLRRWTAVVSPEFRSAPPTSPADPTAAEAQATDTLPVDQRTPALVRVLPRRWLDIYGNKIKDVWEAACRAVIGTIVFRPGISQAELRWRLRAVYDRGEVHDVLLYLLDHGYTTRRLATDTQDVFPADSPADNAEERLTYWFIGERRWFTV